MSSVVMEVARGARLSNIRRWLPDLLVGFNNLMVHRLRSLLTMLGMIFGVAAVVSMLSIGAGAQQKVMAFIEQLGVRNLIVEAKETPDYQDHQKIRRISPGLTFQDYRVIGQNLPELAASTPRKRFTPSKVIPKPQQDMPGGLRGGAELSRIAGLRGGRDGSLMQARKTAARRSACWAQAREVGAVRTRRPGRAIRESGRAMVSRGRRCGAAAEFAGSTSPVCRSQDLNNLIYVPLNSAIFRLEDNYSWLRDEIDGIYLHLAAEHRHRRRGRASCAGS